MDMRLRALNRFGLGARIGEARERFDPRGWLRGQLEPDRARAATRPDETRWTGAISLQDAGDVFADLRAAQRSRDQEAIAAARRRLGEVRSAEASSLLNVRIASEVPFVERLIAFWSNHLCVDEPMDFSFRPIAHEPGAKTVLGNRYGEAGVREGERAIRDLCRHPSTARFVATKLVRHFVDDDPPDAAVTTIEQAFLESEGDLREVSAALIDLDEAWDERHTKLRTPQDWLVAVMRAVRAEEVPPQLVQILRQLRHAPWAPTSPKGYGDTRGEWADPDGLMNRAELARSLAQRVFRAGRGSRGGAGPADDPDPSVILSVIDVDADDPLIQMVEDRSIPAGERFALAIGGPAFQWR